MYRNKIDQAKLAKITGYSRNTINTLCNERGGCRYEVAFAIADALGVDFRELMKKGDTTL